MCTSFLVTTDLFRIQVPLYQPKVTLLKNPRNIRGLQFYFVNLKPEVLKILIEDDKCKVSKLLVVKRNRHETI